MLRTGCYARQMKSMQFYPPIGYIYGSAIVNIRWLTQTFKFQYFGFQVHFKPIRVYNLKTNNDFW